MEILQESSKIVIYVNITQIIRKSPFLFARDTIKFLLNNFGVSEVE